MNRTSHGQRWFTADELIYVDKHKNVVIRREISDSGNNEEDRKYRD